jgi:hypothetical protein
MPAIYPIDIVVFYEKFTRPTDHTFSPLATPAKTGGNTASAWRWSSNGLLEFSGALPINSRRNRRGI